MGIDEDMLQEGFQVFDCPLPAVEVVELFASSKQKAIDLLDVFHFEDFIHVLEAIDAD